MFVVCIIFCNFAVLIVGQRQLVVLCSIDHALLNGCINLAKAHGSCCCTKSICHGNAGRTLLYTDLFAFQIIRCINRCFCIKVSGSCIVPGNHTETCLVCGLVYIFHVIGVFHYGLVNLFGVKQIRHTEDLVYTGKSFQIGSTCHNEINRPCLCQLNGFLC